MAADKKIYKKKMNVKDETNELKYEGICSCAKNEGSSAVEIEI